MTLSVLDWAIIVAYCLVVVGIGVWAMKTVRDAGGYLLANRKMGKWLMVAQTFSGGINSTDPMSTAQKAYQSGLSGIWLSLVYIFATPLFWIWPPVVRRMRVVTPIDMYRMRFGRVFEVLNIIIGVVTQPIGIGTGIKAAALLVVVMAGKDPTTGMDVIGIHTAIAMIVIPTLIYTLLGGVTAIAATDLFQGLLILVLSFIGLPFAIMKVGGMSETASRINERIPNAWALVSESGFSGPMLFWFVVGVLLAAPLVYGQGSGAARNEMAARFQILGNLGKRFCTIGWALIGLFGVAIYFGSPTTQALDAGGQTKFAERIFATVSMDTLPSGLRGVMVAAMLAAVMSTVAGMLLGFGGMVCNNIYKNFLVKDATPKHYLVIARIFTVAPVAVAWYVAASEKDLASLFVIVQQVGGLTGMAVLAAVTWRRATGAAAMAATIAMAPLFYCGALAPSKWPEWYNWLAYRVLDGYHMLGISPGVDLANKALKNSDVIQITNPLYIGAGLVVLIGVSLITKQHNVHTVKEFYARLDTPLGDEQKLRDAGYQADSLEDLDKTQINAEARDRDVSKRLLLLDFFTWPYLVMTGRAKLSDYWVDFAGIAGALVFIVGFLFLVKAIASLFA